MEIDVIGFYSFRDLARVETRASRGTDAVDKYNKGSNMDLYRGAEPRSLFYTRLKASLICNVVDMENDISIWKLFGGDDTSDLRRVASVLLKALDDLF
jgi:hypothetical protein